MSLSLQRQMKNRHGCVRYQEKFGSTKKIEEFSQNPSFNRKSGHWSHEQSAKYYAFLKTFEEEFSAKETRRHWKVFKSLADFLGTRNSNQCRSHHHKMKKQFSSVKQILDSLIKKQPNMESQSLKYEQQLQAINISAFGNVKNKFIPNPNPPVVHSNSTGHQTGKNEQREHQSNGPIRNIESQNPCKKNDVSMLKTGQEYPDMTVMDFKPECQFFNNFEIPVDQRLGCFGNFPSTGILGMIPEENHWANEMNGVHSNQEDNLTGCQLPHETTDRQKKVIECHFFFMKWIETVSSFTVPSYGNLMSF